MTTIKVTTEQMSRDLSKVLYEEGVKKNAEGRWEGEHRKHEGYAPAPMTAELWGYILFIAHDSYIAGMHRVVDEFNRQEEAKATRAQTRAIKRLTKEHSRDLSE